MLQFLKNSVQNTSFTKRPGAAISKALLFCATVSILAPLASCDNQTNTSKTVAVKKTDTSQSALGQQVSIDPGFTLPVLDALFYEDNFEQDLKAKLQLTDAQVQKLKTVAREAVADLSEDGVGDYVGSSRAASKRSEEQIRGIVGDEKANQLFQLVGQRYASGNVEGMIATQPNAVPADTRIVVNIPAYRMDVFQDGKLTRTYKIGIGYPEFPLPTGMRRAETIIFNPTWTPPDEPWVKGKFKPGEKVDAGSKDNPLGPIKIPIGAPSLIHGGKAPAKLGNFASHGCVGLTNDQVQDFAAVLAQLAGSPLSPEEIQNHRKNKTETRSVKLEKAVPVELRYETVVAEGGGLRIFRDVYERGTNTVDNVRRVLNVYGVSYEALPTPEKQAILQALTKMNRDAQGNPIVADIGGSPDDSSSAKAPSFNDQSDPSKSERAKKGKETKTIVGRKEIMVPIATLQGKGYPVPVNLNAGPQQGANANRVRH